MAELLSATLENILSEICLAFLQKFREFLSQYNKITEQCFMACVHDFTTRRVIGAENSCALNCLEKFMKMTNRISQRFQEHQMANNDALAAATAAQKSGS